MTMEKLLRAASVAALVAFAGHTALFLSYAPAHGAGEVAVVAAMKSLRFNFSGFLHSYWELYFGYGLFVSVSCLMESLLLWQLAGLAKSGAQVRGLVGLFALGEVGYAVLMWKFFFPIPIAAHCFLAACLGAAFAMGKTRAASVSVAAR
jgi:hypothetical protein